MQLFLTQLDSMNINYKKSPLYDNQTNKEAD